MSGLDRFRSQSDVFPAVLVHSLMSGPEDSTSARFVAMLKAGAPSAVQLLKPLQH